MVEVIPLSELSRGPARPAHAGLRSFDPRQAVQHRCDAHVMVTVSGTVVARASLWWSATPSLPGERVGVIGHYAAVEAATSAELLAACCAELRARGCTMAIGPMDGNTWRSYRLVTSRGSEPPFFLEPDTPDEWPACWSDAGFGPLANYFSALNSDLAHTDPQVSRARERLRERGLGVRSLDADRFEDELRRIYAISVQSFTGNFLYTPVAEEEFLKQYRAIQPRVIPQLVLMAEDRGEPVGYLFALPDVLGAARGRVDTVIIKTVAVRPERRCAGLGVWLVQEAQRVACELGFTRAIHALMHESNNSLNLSARYAKPFRRYTLFSRHLS